MNVPFAFYGTLREGLATRSGRPPVEALGDYGDLCTIQGFLQDARSYPQLVEGYGTVIGQLWYPHDDSAIEILDRWEMEDPDDPYSPLCQRLQVNLLEPTCFAWVYVYPRNLDLPVINGGDWIEYTKSHGDRPLDKPLD